MELSGLKAQRPIAPQLASGDKRVQTFLRDLEKIKNSKRPRKQLKRSEELIYRIVQALRKNSSDHLLQTTCIWTLINIFRMFPEPAKEMMLAVGVPGVLHNVIASGLLTGSMRQYTSELCFFLSSNQPYPESGSVPSAGPMQKLPEVSNMNRYNGILDDISVTSSELSSVVPEGHRDHSKYAFVPYRINEQNLKKLDSMFNEGYQKQINAALPNPEFMSRFGFMGATARKPYAGTGTGIVGEDWQVSDSDDEEDEDLRNHDDGSINSTISSGSRSLAYSASSGNLSAGTVSLGGSVQSGRYSFSSGISGQGPPINSTDTHGIGVGIHNRQIGKYAGAVLGIAAGVGGSGKQTSGVITLPAMKDYDSWHQRHGPHENPFLEEATPLSTHYRPKTISSERARSTHFRIGGFGVGPAAARNVNATSAIPALGADFSKGEMREMDGFDLASPSASMTLSQLSNEPIHVNPYMTHSQEFPVDAMSSTIQEGSYGFTEQQEKCHRHRRHHHAHTLQHSRSLTEDSYLSFQKDGKRTDEFDPVTRGGGGGLYDNRAPLYSIASSQYGERPSDIMLGSPDPSLPGVSLLDVAPPRRIFPQTAGSPTRHYPSLTAAVHHPTHKAHRSPSHPSTAPHLSVHAVRGRGGGAEGEGRGGKSEIDDFLAQLDPLSLSLNVVRTVETAKSKRANTVGRKIGDANSKSSWLSDDDEKDDDEEDDDEGDEQDNDDGADNSSQTSETDAGFFDSNIVDAPGSRYNEFLARKRMRIRAEKLIDHKFTKKLFSKKATTAQAQNLISRMESLLGLMDPQSTGFVTWECFARLILAVAPTHLLRSDVMAFMDAQTDNDQNLIDYKEFIISGKVMVIDKQKSRKDNLPVTGWLNRQKLYSGEESTHTWQNHIKWYQSRKSKAVVWLMRRATRSMKYSVLLAEAHNFLMNQRKRALAVTYLLEVGYVAVSSQGLWKEATRSLLKRSMHARRWSQTVAAAQAWLANLARGVVEQLRMEEDLGNVLDDASMASRNSIESVMKPTRKKQADYSTFYKLHQYNRMAFTFLTNSAAKALKHCTVQDEVQVSLSTYGHRMLMHQLYTESARNWLKLAGERAYRYCIHCDDTLKSLLRLGKHALDYMDRQEAALKWLLARGAESVKFVASKADSLFSLVEQGQRTLSFLNAREDAFAGLSRRMRKAVVLVARKKEALVFLAKQPLGLWAKLDKIDQTQKWLAQRGAQAVVHLQRRSKTFKLLQLTAGKASTVTRKQNIAYTDLQQIGQEAKISRFSAQCKVNPTYAARVKEERNRILQSDNRKNKERASMHKELRWMTELSDAFEWISVTITPSVYQGGLKALIGRIGFMRLLQQGKLLGTTQLIAYDFFKSVDPGTSCFIPFDNVWPWFQHHAKLHEANTLAARGRELKFTVADIISAEERAQVAVMKRVNNEKIEFTSELDWDALEEKKRRALEEASSSEEEDDDSLDNVDEDTLFSDPRYMQTADIGRMMKYLTKRKQKRDRVAQEEAYQASLREKIVSSAKVAEAARRSAKFAPFSPSGKSTQNPNSSPSTPLPPISAAEDDAEEIAEDGDLGADAGAGARVEAAQLSEK